MRKTLEAALIAVLLAGCGDGLDGHACTEIGCDDQLTVKASSALGSKFGVELTIDGATLSVACDLPGDTPIQQGEVTGSSTFFVDCTSDGIILYAAPDTVGVRFLDEDGTVLGEASLSPDYESFTPNGEECEPLCLQTEEVVETSAAANPNPNA